MCIVLEDISCVVSNCGNVLNNEQSLQILRRLGSSRMIENGPKFYCQIIQNDDPSNYIAHEKLLPVF